MKISVCMVVRDDLPFLRKIVPSLIHASELVIVDTGSRDGTLEWLEEFRRAPYFKHFEDDDVEEKCNLDVKVLRMDPRSVTKVGFAALKNIAASNASGDWIHSLDGDECMSFMDALVLPEKLAVAQYNVFHVETMTYHGRSNDHDWRKVIVSDTADPFLHRRIYRAGLGIQWQGYIHEELYRGAVNCNGGAGPSIARHHHFSNYRSWANPEHKQWRYAWMLVRAFDQKELRNGTNGWWYNSYVPGHIGNLRKMAALYEQHRDSIDPETAQ